MPLVEVHYGSGIVSEIAADYTKEVVEKVQSRAASDHRALRVFVIR